jgi:xanthine dehydrogenase accessory factor
MKEIQEILKCIEGLGPGENAVVATVIDVQGSSYRLPGAKMLIRDSGETCGTVSGGCLEADVRARAQKVTQTGQPQIFTYDTTAVKDSIFSLNMGCRGVIRILLEPVSRDYFNALRGRLEMRRTFLSATIIAAGDEENFPLGKRFYFDEGESGLEAENSWIAQFLSQHCCDDRNAYTVSLDIQNTKIEVFYERIDPPLKLMIFGAGADALPLARIAHQLGWRVSLIDHRAAFATKERFPEAEEILIARPETLAGNAAVDENTAAIVMSHNYENDKMILPFLLESHACYIGALGPKHRTEKILAELYREGKRFSAREFERLFAPVGLDIGADSPETIALSIAAEIQAVMAGRSGGFLRNRIGSIYQREAPRRLAA